MFNLVWIFVIIIVIIIITVTRLDIPVFNAAKPICCQVNICLLSFSYVVSIHLRNSLLLDWPQVAQGNQLCHIKSISEALSLKRHCLLQGIVSLSPICAHPYNDAKSRFLRGIDYVNIHRMIRDFLTDGTSRMENLVSS